MNKKILILMLLFILILAACNSKQESFIGESDNWMVELITMNDGNVEDFVLSYKGTEELLGLVNADLKAGNFGLSISGGELNDDGKLSLDVEKRPNDMAIKKDNKISTTVVWNGNTEEITLNKK